MQMKKMTKAAQKKSRPNLEGLIKIRPNLEDLKKGQPLWEDYNKRSTSLGRRKKNVNLIWKTTKKVPRDSIDQDQDDTSGMTMSVFRKRETDTRETDMVMSSSVLLYR